MSKNGSLLRLAESILVCFVTSAIVLPVCPLTVRFARSCSTFPSLSCLSCRWMEAAVQEIFARVFPKDMVDGRTQPEEVVALDPSTGEVSQLSIDDLADKLD